MKQSLNGPDEESKKYRLKSDFVALEAVCKHGEPAAFIQSQSVKIYLNFSLHTYKDNELMET
ncbi:hypothetical protein BpHYR1_009984 [Brachionus plicatilis]|uniref:Uncharacterized protein n=1 Tax=Brachionus plicatilis TaxID=10195 RepID=A0A3M7RH40_BRAPC|nr:hypothetical protein BpHYR1_009984 [Brachionus plicatilis]